MKNLAIEKNYENAIYDRRTMRFSGEYKTMPEHYNFILGKCDAYKNIMIILGYTTTEISNIEHNSLVKALKDWEANMYE